MSYVNGTTHYNLPQTVGTDKRDWSDTNQAFADLDSAVYGAVQDVAAAGTSIDSLTTRMTTAEGNISTNASNITSLDSRMTTAEGSITSQASQISDVKSDYQDMICAYNEASATSTHAYAVGDYFIYNDVLYRAISAIAVGDTIVPDSNCTTTNVTTEIKLNTVSQSLIDSVTQNTNNIAQNTSDIGMKANLTLIAPVENSTTASKNYTIGDYLILNNTLYIVIKNVNIGDTLVNNTNISTDLHKPFIVDVINPDGTIIYSSAINTLKNYLPDYTAFNPKLFNFVFNWGGDKLSYYSGVHPTSGPIWTFSSLTGTTIEAGSILVNTNQITSQNGNFSTQVLDIAMRLIYIP